MKYILFPILILVLLSVSSNALDFIPYGDLNGTNNKNIKDFVNITGSYFFGDGAGLTGVVAISNSSKGASGPYLTDDGTNHSLNETKLNATIDARSGGSSTDTVWALNSTTMKNESDVLSINKTWFDSVYLKLTSFVWAGLASKPFNSVDNTNGLRIQAGVLDINQSYFSNKYNYTGTCASGTFVQNVTLGGPQCLADTDTDTTYSNSSPISLSGTTFGLSACADTLILAYNSTFGGWQCQSKTSGGGGGTVTSIAAGNGMDFTTITNSGSVTMGTPGTLSGSTSNGVSATSHLHTITTDDTGVCASGVICGGGHDHSDIYLTSAQIELADNYTQSLAFTGTNTKTLTLTLKSGTVANTFTDIDTWNTTQEMITAVNTTGYLINWSGIGDTDTTYSAGNGISLSTTTFSVAGGTALTQDASGLSVTAGGIGDTQIADAYINQALTTTSDVTFNNVTSSSYNTTNNIYAFGNGGCITQNSTGSIIFNTVC